MQDILNHLNEEILDFVTEEEIESEIEQADVFNEKVRLVMIDVDHAMTSRNKSSSTHTDTGELGVTISPMHGGTPPEPSATLSDSFDKLITACQGPPISLWVELSNLYWITSGLTGPH